MSSKTQSKQRGKMQSLKTVELGECQKNYYQIYLYKPQECQRQKECCCKIYVTTLDYTLSSVHGFIFISPARIFREMGAFRNGSAWTRSDADAAHMRKASGVIQMRQMRQMQINKDACIRNWTDEFTSQNTPTKEFLALCGLRTGFTADLGQIRKNRTFSNRRGLNLCTSHILIFGCLRGQDVVGSLKKVAEKIPGTKITQYYLRRHLHRVIKCRRHLCAKSPETFERKLHLFWLKEPLIKI